MSLTGKGIVAVLLGLSLAAPARAAQYYYVAVFGSQWPANLPSHTHSFATFIRATGEGCCAENYQTQAWTISWLSRSQLVEIFRFSPEWGTNLDLHPTLRWALADGQRVSMWGPYQIKKELFDEALRKVAYLRSGAVRYKAVDTGFSSRRVCNCIHAVSGLAGNKSRLHIGVPTFGESASYFITLKLSTWIIDVHRTHDWLIGRLGLCGYPLIRRDLSRNPTENPVLRTLQTASQLSRNVFLRD